ncbi:MAG: hypothetical protein Q8O12_00485 [Candidatus Omnitrophota bacterium]|nr:hypothetical protein [Candidatus Omnitrophota bacterium]
MKFVYKKGFLKRFDLYPALIQELILKKDLEIKSYIEKQIAPYGLRVKKIGSDTFEARVTDKIRIIWIQKEGIIYFALLGDHDEVRRFIRNS